MFTTTDKTLVSWFCFDEEAPKHCSVITVQLKNGGDQSMVREMPAAHWPNSESALTAL